MTVEKPKPKQLFGPITTGANSEMNQSQLLAITCNSLKAREKWRVHGTVGFGFASHWLKNRRESFEPITERSDRNHVITFDSHLKTALWINLCLCERKILRDSLAHDFNELTWPCTWITTFKANRLIAPLNTLNFKSNFHLDDITKLIIQVLALVRVNRGAVGCVCLICRGWRSYATIMMRFKQLYRGISGYHISKHKELSLRWFPHNIRAIMAKIGKN